MIPIYAIIVAGGSGSRMQSAIPKQFLPLLDEPILLHTLKAFLSIPEIKIHLVLPIHEIPLWETLTAEFDPIWKQQIQTRVTIIPGGATRFQSVYCGLKALDSPLDEAIVLVHDGVRPLIEGKHIQEVIQGALQYGAAALAVPMKDTPREILENGQNRSLDRTKIQLMQTPQGFRLTCMKPAFETGEQPHFTDCASVLEFAGYPIHLVPGSYQNLKVTTPEDLLLAEALLRQRLG